MRDRSPSADPPGSSRTVFTAVGRRKTSVARVLLQPGNGRSSINGMPVEQRFPRATHQALITLPCA